MATQSLVVSRDPEILGVLRPLMSELGMDLEVCSELPGAFKKLSKHKFDTVIVDCDYTGDDACQRSGYDLLATLRQQRPNQKTVAVGITRSVGDVQAVFDSGATFVLSKPLPVEDARRILRISKGVFTRVVRRFMRLPVEKLSTATLGEKYESIILNLSQRGLAVQAPEKMAPGQMIYVSFLLPDTFNLIEGMAQVMWADPEGRAGLEFRALSDEAQGELNDWVFARARAQNPNFQYPANPGSRGRSGTFSTQQMQALQVPPQQSPANAVQLVKPVASLFLGVLLDMLAVALGTGLFLGFGVLFNLSTGHPMLGPKLAEFGLGAGIAFWLLYRFLFFFFRVASPGERMAQYVTEARARTVTSRTPGKTEKRITTC